MYRPSIGLSMLVGAFVAEFFLGRSGLIFATCLVVVYAWANAR